MRRLSNHTGSGERAQSRISTAWGILVRAGAIAALALAIGAATGALSTPLAPTVALADQAAVGGTYDPVALGLDVNKTGSVSVTLKDPKTGAAVCAGKIGMYKIADVVAEDGDYRFAAVSKFESMDGKLGDVGQSKAFDQDLSNKLLQLAKAGKLSPDYPGVSPNQQGTVTFNNLSVGLYLVVQTEAAIVKTTDKTTTYTVTPFLVTVPLLSDGALQYDVNAAPKMDMSSKTEDTPKDNPPTPVTPVTPSGGGAKLPQTGQLWWPIVALLSVGSVALLVGWLMRRSSKAE